jgi:hypothetical protein
MVFSLLRKEKRGLGLGYSNLCKKFRVITRGSPRVAPEGGSDSAGQS